MVITSIIITNVKIHCSKMEEPFCFFGRPCTNDYIQLLKEESMLERIKDLKTAVKIERDEELRNYESVINNQSIQFTFFIFKQIYILCIFLTSQFHAHPFNKHPNLLVIPIIPIRLHSFISILS